jgi:hypothetical protein
MPRWRRWNAPVRPCQQVDLTDREGVVEGIEKAALDALALEAQVTHGLEVQILVKRSGLVGHLEQGVVGVVEQCLQALAQLQAQPCRALAGATPEGKARALRTSVDGCRQGHHLAFFLHPGLLDGCCVPDRAKIVKAMTPNTRRHYL